jgi:hypothetical protein
MNVLRKPNWSNIFSLFPLFLCFKLFSITLIVPAFANVDIVVDDFESYAGSNAAMQSQWVSSTGSTTSTFLFDQNTPGQPYPMFPSAGAVDGYAAIFDGTIGVGGGSINKWATPFSAVPSATQNVVLSVDLGYDQILNNKRLTLGLRYVNGMTTENILELGFWNGLPFPPFTQFAHRTVLFPGSDNWQPYALDPAIDTLAEMPNQGLGFHRFTATISLTDVTFGLDLFNDGINNLTGLPGIDAEDVVVATVSANGFNDLRFGVPSAGGASGNPLLALDNISLRLVNIVPEPTSLLLAGLLGMAMGCARTRR